MTWWQLIGLLAATLAAIYMAVRAPMWWRARRRNRMRTSLAAARSQLASHRLDVRMIGITGLERVAGRDRHGARMAAEVLCGFLREHAYRPPEGSDGTGGAELGADVRRAAAVVARCRLGDDGVAWDVALDLSGADLARAALSDALFAGARLSGARLDGADLWKADLRGADLTGAHLRDANLSGARLDGALLEDASLSGADLEQASLRNANLARADLARADLTLARLEGADLSGATGLTDAQVESAYVDDRTRLPELRS